jgi:hypothetical protein
VNEIEKTPPNKDSASRAITETVLILLLFFLFAGWPPPDVNEAHYLAKAKHYWNPQWCSGDLFLESGQAHLAFYWTFGWLTLMLPLPAVAWIGRLVTWAGLAWAWRRLSNALVPRPWMSVLTASLLLLLLDGFHMAGEWVVGGVEAKGLAYVFALLALREMVCHRWRLVWVFLGIATCLHVLVGGWSWIAAMVAWASCGPCRPPLLRTANRPPMLPAMVLGALLALPGIAAGLLLAEGADAATIRDANLIYVYHRLDHHLVFHRFSHWFIFRHAALLVVWIVICYLTPCRVAADSKTSDPQAAGTGRSASQRPLRGFVGGAVLIALGGIIIDQSLLYHLDIAASLLKYYWYRLSDVFVPLGVALGLGGMIDGWWLPRPRTARWLLIGCMLVSGGYLGWINHQRRADLRPRADVQMLPSWPDDPQRTGRKLDEWRRVCHWIRENTASDAVFITPRHQQTFKWYAERAEVFSWKDVPQDPVSVVHWWQRQQRLYPRRVVRWGFAAHGEKRLIELARQYGASYIVVDRDNSARDLKLPRIYPAVTSINPTYAVYAVPRP